MDAFKKAIQRIDEIKMDERAKTVFVQSMEDFSRYFSSLDGVNLDFDLFFEKYLYNNLKIEFTNEFEKSIYLESKDINGQFLNKENKILLSIKNINKADNLKSVFIHEFVHFIIHNNYASKLLPAWADEMMTEFTANQIEGKNGGAYQQLMVYGKVLDKFIEKRNIVEFINGKFDDYINRNKLDFVFDSPTKFDKDQINNYFISMITKRNFDGENFDVSNWLNTIFNYENNNPLNHIGNSITHKTREIYSNALKNFQPYKFYYEMDTSKIINLLNNYYFLEKMQEDIKSKPQKLIYIETKNTNDYIALCQNNEKVYVMQYGKNSSGYYQGNMLYYAYGKPLRIGDDTYIPFDKNKNCYDLSQFKDDKHTIQKFETDKQQIIKNLQNEIQYQMLLGQRVQQKFQSYDFYQYGSNQFDKVLDLVKTAVIDKYSYPEIGIVKDNSIYNQDIDYRLKNPNVLKNYDARNIAKLSEISQDFDAKTILQYIYDNNLQNGDIVQIVINKQQIIVPVLNIRVTKNAFEINNALVHNNNDLSRDTRKKISDIFKNEIENELKLEQNKKDFALISNKIK